MKRATFVALGAGAIIGSAAAIGIANGDAGAFFLSRTEYRDGMARVDVRRGNALARCESSAAALREVCRAEALAEATIRVAELEERLHPDDHTARGVQRARIDGRYQVARVRCQPLSGYQKDRCLIAAHAARGRALLLAQAPYERRN
jgi:hypothetical protein